ncbi:MAG: hypothetical protein HND58_13120 [Planctomycetota bacterium]|nr:MAG: hypothetical protein HND58_13120 [Planctomycetota bacterium]
MPGWVVDRDVIVYGSVGLQLLGVVALLAFLPLALRLLWDTVPLGPGGLRDGLVAMCGRYRVRVRNILVWRTHGAMINGAVVGLLPRLRYIVLTDALLETLSGAQVEAVARTSWRTCGTGTSRGWRSGSGARRCSSVRRCRWERGWRGLAR